MQGAAVVVHGGLPQIGIPLQGQELLDRGVTDLQQPIQEAPLQLP